MTGMHGDHVLIEAVAAFALTAGGAALLLQAWFERGRPEDPMSSVRERRPSGTALTAALIVVLSGAAAAIHLAAGPEHVEELGDIGLGFYWAAIFQAGFAIAWLVSARSRGLAWIGIVGNGVLIALWLVARTVGLPFLAGVEPIEATDAICVALEVGLVIVLASTLREAGRVLGGERSLGLGTTGIVAVTGVAVLAAAIAVVDVGAGHHADPHTTSTAHLTSP
jgi:hypothetical protein